MTRLAGRDYQALLDVLRVAGETEVSAPFSSDLLEQLRCLVPCNTVSYGELELDHAPGWRRGIQFAGEPAGPLTSEIRTALQRLKSQDPFPPSDARAGAMRFSDLLSRRELRRLEFYWEVLRPLGCEYQLVLWLVAPDGVIGGFHFDREKRDFSERDRLVLNMLAPHLLQLAARARPSKSGASCGAAVLSAREREVMRHVAAGLTTREIAAALHISPGTVRKHLDNVFAKVGVHTRAAAVAHLARDRAPKRIKGQQE